MNFFKEFFEWFISLFYKTEHPVEIEKETIEIEPIENKIEEIIKIEEEQKMSEFTLITESKTTYYAPKNVGTKYKDVTLESMNFPDQAVNSNLKISMGATIMKEYYPIIKDLNYSRGLKLLAIIMANKEGFTTTSRSYKTNNPGNIGNTDSGANNNFKTLKDGIIGQLEYLTKVANNQHSAYKFGPKVIKPYYSPEIAKNPKVYVISPYLPGYKFNYNGELAGFVKIYATGSRGGNGYLSMIISWFKQQGITITENTTLKEIENIK